jgi:hypothetical protein
MGSDFSRVSEPDGWVNWEILTPGPFGMCNVISDIHKTKRHPHTNPARRRTELNDQRACDMQMIQEPADPISSVPSLLA